MPDTLGERDEVSAVSERVFDAVYSENSTHEEEDGECIFYYQAILLAGE